MSITEVPRPTSAESSQRYTFTSPLTPGGADCQQCPGSTQTMCYTALAASERIHVQLIWVMRRHDLHYDPCVGHKQIYSTLRKMRGSGKSSPYPDGKEKFPGFVWNNFRPEHKCAKNVFFLFTNFLFPWKRLCNFATKTFQGSMNRLSVNAL